MCYACRQCGACGKYKEGSPVYVPPAEITCLQCGAKGVDGTTGICPSCGARVLLPPGPPPCFEAREDDGRASKGDAGADDYE